MARWALTAAAVGMAACMARGQAANPPPSVSTAGTRAPLAPESDPVGEVAFGLEVGTLGGGVQATVGLHPKLNLRGGYSYLHVNMNSTIDGIDYDLTPVMSSWLAMLDWHPSGSQWRMSAGALFNGSEVRLNGVPTSAVDIGGNSYPAEMISMPISRKSSW